MTSLTLLQDQYIFIHRVIVDYLRSRDPASPFKGYSLLPKNENEEGEKDPDSGKIFMIFL